MSISSMVEVHLSSYFSAYSLQVMLWHLVQSIIKFLAEIKKEFVAMYIQSEAS